ncbi:tetratricopeptide repeat protein [Microscilla marina]|nr:tetratricopeptide repeat protein [Microscilla marina]
MDTPLLMDNIPDFDIIADKREKIEAICEFCDYHRNAYPDASYKWAQKGYQLSKDLGFREGEVRCLKNIGYHHWHLSQVSLALKELNQCKQLMDKIAYYDQWGEVTMMKAMIWWSEGKYERAMGIVYDGIQLLEAKKMTKPQGWAYWALGVFNYDLKNYDKSLRCYGRALEIFNCCEPYNVDAESWCLLGLSTVYRAKSDTTQTWYYLHKAEQVSTLYNQWMQIAQVHYEMGHLLFEESKFEEAEDAFCESYQIREKYQFKPAMVSCLMAISDVKVQQNQPYEAMDCLQKALEIATETNTRAKLYKCHKKIAELYKSQQNYKEAYYHIELFYQIHSEIAGGETSSNLNMLEAKFTSEKVAREKEIHRLKHVELKHAHDAISKKNKEILASINYAQRIQQAILPPLDNIRQRLPQSFILFQPRDIVSGDFYWFKETEDKIFIAAIDCTGHGVPGAFMSMIGNELLHKIISDYHITQVDQVLDAMNVNIRKALKQKDTHNTDGMEMGLVAIHKQSHTMEFAGARSPLVYIQHNELFQIKGDNMPIGGIKLKRKKHFTRHLINLEHLTTFYLFSDGYQDQFGGENSRQFMITRFRELLLSIHQRPIAEQKQALEEVLADWMQHERQIDDILVIGVRLGA